MISLRLEVLDVMDAFTMISVIVASMLSVEVTTAIPLVLVMNGVLFLAVVMLVVMFAMVEMLIFAVSCLADLVVLILSAYVALYSITASAIRLVRSI